MRTSEIAELAAAIAAGSISYSAAIDRLDDDGDVSILDSLIAGGAGALGGAIGGSVARTVMRKTGISRAIDDIADDLFGF